MERIVVGIDEEDSSDAAVRWVVQHAKRTAATVHLVTCIDVLMMMDRTPEEARLAMFKRQIESQVPATTVTTSTLDGPIQDLLVAASEDADLVVVGFRRSHPVLTALAGSIAARVASRSHCPTVIVPEGWEAGDPASVVVGISDDGSDAEALIFAAEEASRTHRELIVVHAWQLPSTGWDPVAAMVTDEDEAWQFRWAQMNERTEAVRQEHPDLRVTEVLVLGDPAAVLLERASVTELFVIGSHGRGPFSGLILGSTAHKLLPHSKVPVCVVPVDSDVDQEPLTITAARPHHVG